jgi:hypothetical protein
MFTGEIKNQISLTEVSFAHPLAGSPHILAIPSLFLTASGGVTHRLLTTGRGRRQTTRTRRLQGKPELRQGRGKFPVSSFRQKMCTQNQIEGRAGGWRTLH